MKQSLVSIFLLVTTSLQAAQLTNIDASIFELALADSQLTSDISFDIMYHTIEICNTKLADDNFGQLLLSRIAFALKLNPATQPVVIAQELARLILDNPTTLQTLYTLTQLTQAVSNIELTELLTEKTTTRCANNAILMVIDALAPFIKQERNKKICCWIWISFGIALGSLLAQKAYSYLKQQENATARLAAVRQELAQTQEMQANLAAQLANNATIPFVQNMLQPLCQQEADLLKRITLFEQRIQANATTTERLLLAQKERLDHSAAQQSRLDENIRLANTNAQEATTALQAELVEAMTLVSNKFAALKVYNEACINYIGYALTEQGPPPPIPKKVAFDDLLEWGARANQLLQFFAPIPSLIQDPSPKFPSPPTQAEQLEAAYQFTQGFNSFKKAV